MSWSIVNLVATADLKQKVDISAVANLPYTIHDSEIYGGRVTYLKTPEMSGKITIFPSGKLISVGTKSPEQAQSDLSYSANLLARESLADPIILEAVVRNIVALAAFEIQYNLENISDLIGAMYEPEQFPGAILKLDEVDATFLIFQSGKVVISGTNSIENLEKAFFRIENILQKNSDKKITARL